MIHIDKRGSPFDVRIYSPEDYPRLEEMYDSFTPKAKFQGMPPIDKEACRVWLKNLTNKGENFLAWREGNVIGHVVVLPDFSKNDAEYLIFLGRSDRGCGVGSELTRAVIQRAKELELKTIWLTVDAYNFRATRLYKKFGLQFYAAYRSQSERMMTLEL